MSAASFRKLLLLEPKSIKGLSNLASMLHYDMADNIQLNEGDPHAADASRVVPTYQHYRVDQGPKGRSAYAKGAFETYQDVLSEATSLYRAVLSNMQEQRSRVQEARKGTDARKRRKEEALLQPLHTPGEQTVMLRGLPSHPHAPSHVRYAHARPAR